MNQSELFAALKERAVLIEAAMHEDLTAIESPLLKEIIHHAIFQGGKRIRPLLTLLAAELCAAAPAGLARLALAFEYLHAASLLHDDVIDHASLRRGAKTANRIWGMEPVILAGDYLHARALALAGEVGGPEIMVLVGRATAAMVESEFIQMANARELMAGEEGYFKVLEGKTAALIAAACEAGAVFAGGGADRRLALRVYGANLGLAFQIVDDILDYLGDPVKTGKAGGNDFQEGKMTLPLIKAMEQAGDADYEALLCMLRASPEARAESFALGLRLLGKYNGFSLAREKAEELIRQALAGLGLFADTRAKELLVGLADYVLSREK